jgi:hypothetical protein
MCEAETRALQIQNVFVILLAPKYGKAQAPVARCGGVTLHGTFNVFLGFEILIEKSIIGA